MTQNKNEKSQETSMGSQFLYSIHKAQCSLKQKVNYQEFQYIYRKRSKNMYTEIFI